MSLSPTFTGLESARSCLGNSGLYSLMGCHNLRHLHLANTDMFRMDFDEGLSPLLSACGYSLVTLILDRFKHVDVSFIGQNCPKLRKLSLSHIINYGQLVSLSESQFRQLEEVSLENQYGATIVSNILRQLLCFSAGLQHLSLLLVDSLDDVLWSEVITSSLSQLVSLSVDQCHCLSGDSLGNLLARDNKLQVLNAWSCRFITNKDRDHFKNIVKMENYDVSIR